MNLERKISHIYSAIPTIEGAGVHLKRVFGNREAPTFDPSNQKMIKPRYRDVSAETIPEYRDKNGVIVKVISGNYKGHAGPVKDIICDPEYLDIQIPPHQKFEHSIESGYTVLAYVLNGEGYFDADKEEKIKAEQAALFSDGSKVRIEALDDSLRFVLISGKPLRDPIAWRGPIVMNTEEELAQAFEEYRNGTFIKESS